MSSFEKVLKYQKVYLIIQKDLTLTLVAKNRSWLLHVYNAFCLLIGKVLNFFLGKKKNLKFTISGTTTAFDEILSKYHTQTDRQESSWSVSKFWS